MFTTVLTIAFGVVVGAFVGWHVPQPSWVKKAQDKVVEEAKETVAEVKTKVTRARKNASANKK